MSRCAETQPPVAPESIILAVKTARDWARNHKPQITKPHVVVPESVHPAFSKPSII
ncbi:MAG: hypothetical protein IPN22_05165 [Bacteroidetes bacterium]|nr:hypothetical protein [Bacteroidota bacterium]